MADTQRSRAQLLALFADNVTGQISAQDFRDFLVTVMEEEFSNAGDYWKQPETRKTTTDKYARGWIDYSQIAGSDFSFMNVVYMTTSGMWKRADVSTSTMNGVLGLALNSYTSNASNVMILRDGMVYNSTFSATFSGFIGRPIYLASGSPGSVTTTKTTNSVAVIGWVECSDDGGAASGKFRFKPDQWAVKGS